MAPATRSDVTQHVAYGPTSATRTAITAAARTRWMGLRASVIPSAYNA